MSRRAWTTIITIIAVVVAFTYAVVGLWQPGSPAVGSAEREAYNSNYLAALYSALFAGIITGIVTGVVVGLVVWRVQERQRSADQRVLIEREIAVLRLQLRAALSDPDVPNIDDDPQALWWLSSYAAAEVVLTVPTHEWRPYAPTESAFLGAVEGFQEACIDFRGSARALYWEVIAAVGLATRDPNIENDEVHRRRAYCLVRLAGEPPDKIKLSIATKPDETIRAWEATYKEILRSEDVTAARGRFEPIKQRLHSETKRLRERVRTNPSVPRIAVVS